MHYFARTLVFKKKFSAWEQFVIFLKGVLIGTFVFVPGVGMATISLTLNMYDEFIDLLHDLSQLLTTFFRFFIGEFNLKNIKKHLNNIFSDHNIPLFIGFVFGFAICSFAFRFVLDNAPAYVRAMFFGIVLATVATPLKHAKEITSKDKLVFLVSFGLFFYLFGFYSNNIFYAPSIISVILSGLLSSVSFVLPGIGGSFVLIIFNSYRYFVNVAYSLVYTSLSTSQLINLVLFSVSFIFGFVLTIRFVRYLLSKYRPTLMALFSGVLLASLRLMYPFITVKGDMVITSKPFDLPFGQTIALILVLIVSYLIARTINNSGNNREPIKEI